MQKRRSFPDTDYDRPHYATCTDYGDRREPSKPEALTESHPKSDAA